MSIAIDLLVVDDDADFRGTLLQRFSRRGYTVHEAADGGEALGLAKRRQYDVAIVALGMPRLAGMETLARLKAAQPECEIIVLAGPATVATAVNALKQGACDYLTKPCSLIECEVLVEKAAERRQLSKENVQLKEVLHRQPSEPAIVGDSAVIKEVRRLIEQAGPTDDTVLIGGESGTGKELVARALHRRSLRSNKQFVTIDCATQSETLLERELLGREKGAFSGAANAIPGAFELADGGTLFINGIGDMPRGLQAKLLRALEDSSVRRVGSLQQRRLSVRVLVATNRNMANEVRAGRFRADLYQRVSTTSLQVPPLRQRSSDVPLLVEYCLGSGWQIEPEAQLALERYEWPGNTRQLIDVIERAKVLADDGRIRLDDLTDEVAFAFFDSSLQRALVVTERFRSTSN